MRHDSTKWCLHVSGMDEVHPAPDRATAQLWAAQWTVWQHSKFPTPHPYDPVLNYSVAVWPYSDEAHSDGLEKSMEGNTFPVDPLPAANLHNELVEALEGMVEHYVNLAGCGDCGNWNPEEEGIVIATRALLARASGGPS